ncbi:MAG: Type prenyl endopeptidase Rce1-like [Cryptosporangiaceae bacterium]|nr:Type prenyl endopeptidase Rce1-like [Cryptosporangiaceae bacterium]
MSTREAGRAGAGLAARVGSVLPLAAGFAAAVGLRAVIGGPGIVTSPTAGLAFAACLTALVLAVGTRLSWAWRDLRIGLVGAAVLCAPAVIVGGFGARPLAGLGGWLAVVTLVAAAEEAFLRGSLYDALGHPAAAIGGSALAFALLHVPLYGWRTVPLDFAAGIVLGLVRHRSGSATAPAIAHVAADWAAWFLR